MKTMTTKKEFLHWFLKNHKTKTKEGAWILNYILSNSRILERVQFVEYAKGTECGLRVASADSTSIPFTFFKGEINSTKPEEAFKEIKTSVGPIFIEIHFENRLTNPLFISALEDVGVIANEDKLSLSERDLSEIDKMLAHSIKEGCINRIQRQIDHALATGDRVSFLALSAQYMELTNN